MLFLQDTSQKIVFSSLMAFCGMLTSYCDNLLTHHYHVTYHPCFDTQFLDGQTTQQYFRARRKRKRSSSPFVPKRSVDKDWADKLAARATRAISVIWLICMA